MTKNSATIKSPGTKQTAASDRADHATRTRLIEALCDTVNEHLIEYVATLLANLPDSLRTKAEASTDTEKKMQLSELQRLLSIKGNDINCDFFIALNEKLKPATNAAQPEADELALVSEEEMEEMVAITTMHAHAMSLFGNEVNHLEVRLEYLEITTQSRIEKESLSPKRLGEAFMLALKPLNMELKDRLELFAMFNIDVTPKLAKMYKALNTLLIKAGVMPKILLKETKKEEKAEPEEISTRTANYYDPQANPSTNFIPRTPQDIAYLASQFMQGDFIASENAINLPESFRKPVGKRDIDGKNYYARNEVVKALSQLQNHILKHGKVLQQASIEEIKQSLFSEMSKQDGGVVTKKVNVLDERSIDFVGMMFDAITHDESLSSIIKNLLLRLQIPVIKVAMSDVDLFKQESHPTREVLNLVTEAGKGVNDEADRIYNQLENIVDGILKEYDVDIESFNKAAASLHNLIESEHKVSQENEEREQQAVMVAHAREVVVSEIKHVSANKIIPKNVLPLVTKSWPSLMMNRYIRHGNDSWQWLESVMLIKLLIKCLQPIKDDTQWQRVWANHLALTEAVHDELNTSKQDKAAINEQIDALKGTFMELLDAYGYKLAETETQAPVSTDNIITAANDDPEDALRSTQLEEIARLAQEKLSQLPSMVHPGVWFEIFNGDDKAVRRLKLSVILTGVARLVFVDRKGIKVIEKDAGDFANELSNEKSRFIADHSTFDHALGQVIHSIAA